MFDVPLSQMPVAPSRWKKHMPTTVYERNYNFGINYYQPMIDLIERKESGEVPREGTRQSTRNISEHEYVVPYTQDELARHVVAAELHAKEHLNYFKVLVTANLHARLDTSLAWIPTSKLYS